MEFNSRELKSNNEDYSFISSKGKKAQEINSRLLITDLRGWLWNVIAGSRSLARMFTPLFSIRVRITQEITRQLLITGHAWGLLWNTIAGS